MWVTDMEIGEIRRKLERKSSKVEVQENDQKIIEHIENKQSQSEEQETQETFVKQGHENEQQQKIQHISSFQEEDEILVKKAEMESYNEEEKKLLMRVEKEIRYDPERIPPKLRQVDRKKVKTATVKINNIVSLIKTETIIEINLVLRAASNIVAKIEVQCKEERCGSGS